MQILGQPQLEKGATGQEGGEEGKNIQKIRGKDGAEDTHVLKFQFWGWR